MAISVFYLHLDFSKEAHHVHVFKFPHIKDFKRAQIRPGPKGARAQMDPRAKWAQGPNGPRPSWAWGPNGPRPNWAQGLNGCKAHMGPGCGSTGNRGSIAISISTYNVILYDLTRPRQRSWSSLFHPLCRRKRSDWAIGILISWQRMVFVRALLRYIESVWAWQK